MHSSSLAPVLSATRSLLSCWITAASLRLLEDLHDPPVLGGGQRAGLHEEHAVPDATRVRLVVRLVLLRAPDRLAVQRVLHAVLDGDDDGLVHLVADHEALADLAVAPLDRCPAGGLGTGLAHALVLSTAS